MSGKTKTKTTQKNDLSPWAQQTYDTNVAPIRDYTSSPATPYTEQMAADKDPLQQQAEGLAGANVGVGQGTLQSAIQAAMAAGGYAPEQVGAGQLAGMDYSQYMNPYTDAVLGSTLSAIDRQRQMGLVGNAQQMTQAGAFNGSRHGVADSLTNEAAMREASSAANGIYSDAFRNAQGAGQFDISAALQAALANQGAGLAGAGLNLNAGSQLAGMGAQEQQMGANDATLLNQFGQQNYQIQNNQLGMAYQEFLRQQQDQAAKAGLNLGIMGATPYPQYSRGTQTQSSSPGAAQLLGGALNAASMLMGGPAAAAAGGGSAGSTLMAALPALSDRRLKKDVEHALTDGKGRRWYDYRYIWQDADEPKQRGVMAQELTDDDAKAVFTTPAGYLGVNYGALQ